MPRGRWGGYVTNKGYPDAAAARNPSVRCIAYLSLLLLYSQGHAQILEEVIVSAQKREQNSQDVGIAMTVFTAADFASLELRNSTDLVALTPGVSLAGSYGGEFLTFSIRGVTQSDFSDHAESPTSVYVDDGYVAMIMTQRFALFDMDRAEILKGPQGTLFGRNSTGGNVNFLSRQPTDIPEGYVNVSYGSFNTTRLEAAVSGPLADRITGRLAVLYNFQSPILTNSYPGAGDLWNDNTYAYRGHLKVQLGEDTEALLTAYGGASATASSPWQWKGTIGVLNAKGQLVNIQNVGATETRECIGPGGANVDCGNDVTGLPDGITITRPVAGGDWFGYRELPGTRISQDVPDGNVNALSLTGGTINLRWHHQDISALSITDYKSAKKHDQLDGEVSPARGLNTYTRADTDSYSQEFRFLGSVDRLRWLGGLYYLNIDAQTPDTGIWLGVDGNTPTIVAAGLQGMQFLDTFYLKTHSSAAFGQVEYDLASSLTIISGFRVTDEEKYFDYSSGIYREAQSISPTVFSLGQRLSTVRTYMGHEDDILINARAELDWKPKERWLLYASVSRGAKAGSFNAPLAGNAAIADAAIPYRPEVLNAYELGNKSTFYGGRLQVNAATFYYDYRNYQAFQIIGLANEVTNKNAQYHGLELDLKARPLDPLLLQLSGSYLHTVVFDVLNYGIIGDKQAAYAPNFQANFLARYHLALGSLDTYLQLGAHYTSPFYYSLTNFDADHAAGYITWNSRLAFRPTDRLEIAGFVDNLTDRRGGTVSIDLATTCGCALQAYLKPRTGGIEMNYKL